MRPFPILILALALATAGCASPGGAKLPVCDGRHLRPANPHGSVLDPTQPATAAANPVSPAVADGHSGCGQ